MPDKDVFDAFEGAICARSRLNPWAADEGGGRGYRPDYDLLGELVGIPIAAGSGSESGRLAKAIDAWVASELRRAGFGDDEVWPRLSKPRVLPRDLALFAEALPACQSRARPSRPKSYATSASRRRRRECSAEPT